jgi:3-oxoacyl-[acyl-carrier protein] reductase
MTTSLLAEPGASQEVIARTPLGRLGTPPDIARAALFLASDEAAWVTGQVLQASGGLLL